MAEKAATTASSNAAFLFLVPQQQKTRQKEWKNAGILKQEVEKWRVEEILRRSKSERCDVTCLVEYGWGTSLLASKGVIHENGMKLCKWKIMDLPEAKRRPSPAYNNANHRTQIADIKYRHKILLPVTQNILNIKMTVAQGQKFLCGHICAHTSYLTTCMFYVRNIHELQHSYITRRHVRSI